jgi:predicted PurR-regulated permease PerM
VTEHQVSSPGELQETVDAVATKVEARVTDMIIRLALLGMFVFWALDLVGPFVPVAIWSVILAVALQPVHAWLAARLGGASRLAAALLTLVLLAIVIGPVALLGTSLAEALQGLSAGVGGGTLRVPPPPPGIEAWPIIGHEAEAAWSLASRSLEDALKEYAPTLTPIVAAILHRLAAMSFGVLILATSVVIAGFLFVSGAQLAEGGRAFAERVVASRGAAFVDLAGLTIRNVSRGVIGVAAIQALLAGVVLAVAGFPGAGLLAFLILVLCIVQIGPAPVLLPIIVWVWVAIPTVQALMLTVVLVPITLLDNVLKPMLMGRGLRTPTLIIFIGVVGGTITHGLLGLFLGPVVLAVLYDLVVAWVRRAGPAAAAAPEPPTRP